MGFFIDDIQSGLWDYLKQTKKKSYYTEWVTVPRR